MLKQIARVNGVKGWASTTKSKLVESLQSKEIVMNNLRVTELKSPAKVRGIQGYKKMRHDDLVEALTASIPEDNEPIPGVSKPPHILNLTSLSRLLQNAEESVQSCVDDLQDWVSSQIPEPINKKKRVLSQKFN